MDLKDEELQSESKEELIKLIRMQEVVINSLKLVQERHEELITVLKENVRLKDEFISKQAETYENARKILDHKDRGSLKRLWDNRWKN